MAGRSARTILPLDPFRQSVHGAMDMKRQWLVFLGLLLPFVALAQTANQLAIQANDKKIHGDYNGALADYTQAIAQDPKNVPAYIGRATVLSLEGNYAGAIADDTKAISFDPRNAVAYSNRGNAKAAKGDLTGALADYTRAIAIDPHHVRAFLNRGNVKNLQKKYHAAIDDYTAAIALDPQNANAYYNRAGAERAVADYASATTDYSKAIELNPADVKAYLNRAVLRLARQDWSGATADLNKCLSLVPEERQAYPRIYLWIAKVKQGEADKATQELTRYLDQSPKTLAGTWGWEIAQFLAGQVDEASFITSADSFQVKQDRGQAAQAFYYAGLKRALAGDKAGAEKYFKRCVEAGHPFLHEFILAREELKLSGGSGK
ncbi:MAG: tetratricopeptide repeat protein [Methylacidiphilales bacterium]|nr:tetratricopeptide repeat protein [Candidatus Methylacidiphilales bacterium]